MEKLEKVLYNIAKEDLSVSKFLYEKRKYSQSLFYFQQSVEKANKAFGLLAEIIQPEELASAVGHDPMKIYKKNLDARRKEIEQSIISIQRFPKVRQHELFSDMKTYRKQLMTGQQFLDNLKNRNITKLTYNDLNFVLDELEELEKVKFTFPENDELVIDKSFEKVFSFMTAFGTTKAMQEKEELEGYLRDPKSRKEFMNVSKIIIQKQLEFTFISYTLYFCAIVSMPHTTKARYPFLDTKFNPLKTYNRNFPLVNLQPYFMRLMRKTIRKMPELFDVLQKGS